MSKAEKRNKIKNILNDKQSTTYMEQKNTMKTNGQNVPKYLETSSQASELFESHLAESETISVGLSTIQAP